MEKIEETAGEARDQFDQVIHTPPDEWTTGQKVGVGVGVAAAVLILLCILKCVCC